MIYTNVASQDVPMSYHPQHVPIHRWWHIKRVSWCAATHVRTQFSFYMYFINLYLLLTFRIHFKIKYVVE